jgi:two-component system, NarL family, sensor histidine kinase BarA
VIIIGLLSLYQYTIVADDRNNQFFDDISDTEISLHHSVNVLYESLKLFDSRYDYEMEMILSQIANAYLESDGNISSLNLSAYKSEYTALFPGVIDFYLINSSNVVEKTTYFPDLGLDFKTIPKFSASLDAVRNGDRFIADQWVDSINTPGYYRKYAYYPTQDHSYIIEMGLHSEDFWIARKDVFSYEKLGNNFLAVNSDLVALSFFNKNLDTIDSNIGRSTANSAVCTYIPVDELKAKVTNTFKTGAGQQVINGSYVIQYQYFKIRNNLTPSSSEMNLVGVLVYSRHHLDTYLENYLIIHLIITVLAIIISILFATYISRYISRPLEEIIGDIEHIARGNYRHPIRITGGKDIDRLGQSVQMMVSTILNDVELLQKAQLKIERELKQRMSVEEALTLANSKLNNLSSITRHDILNQVTCIRGYAYLIENTHNSEEIKHYSHDIQRLSRIIEEIISFSRDYHTIGVQGSTWQNLEEIIRSSVVVPFHDKISLHIEALNISILADPLLQKVFYNLVDNSLKHGGEGGAIITISFTQEGEYGVIVYSDLGKGIASEDKERIFEKGFGSGSGLGLFLIKEILSISSMTIREKGVPGKGVRFEIMVPRDQFRIG